jgi:hypothetical protein
VGAFCHQRIVPAGDLARVLVLVHKDRFSSSAKLKELRGQWSPIFMSRDGQMVLLAHASTPKAAVGTEKAWWRISTDSAQNVEPGTYGHPYVRNPQ